MKWLRWIGIVLAALAVIVAVVGISLYLVGGRKLARKMTVEVAAIDLPTDSLSIAEGARYARIFGCTDCHGPELQGDRMIEDPVLGEVVAPHIARGAGSVTADFTTQDWVRAIRHGIGGDGRPLVIMPASHYVDLLSAEDLANIIAYVRQAEPVDHDPGRTRLRLAQVLLGAGVFPLEYDKIDHAKRPLPKPDEADTLAFGHYMSGGCRICHGGNLMGNEEFGGPAIARGGVIESYDEDAFRTLFRTGQARNGRMIETDRMPWNSLGKMTDDELHAVWTYVRSVSAPAP